MSFPFLSGYRSQAEVQEFINGLREENRQIIWILKHLSGKSGREISTGPIWLINMLDLESRQRTILLKSEMQVVEANIELLEGLAKQFEIYESGLT